MSERQPSKLPKITALAAPVLLFAAHACTTENQKTPQENQINTTQTVRGEVGGVSSGPSVTVEPTKATPTTTPNNEISPTPDSFFSIKYDAENDVNIITDRTYSYELIPETSFQRFLTDDGKWVLQRYLPQSVVDSSWGNLREAAILEQQNKNDPQIFELAKTTVRILEPYCIDNGQNQFRGFPRGLTKEIASAVYNNDPQKWRDRSDFFLTSPCFPHEAHAMPTDKIGSSGTDLGPRATDNATPDNSGFITLSDGSKLWSNYAELETILSKDYGFEELMKKYGFDDVTIRTYFNGLNEANQSEQSSEEESSIIRGINKAVIAVIDNCDNRLTPNAIRLAASFVYHKYPNSWTKTNTDLYLNRCSLKNP